ncbi:hypothetical protein NE237_024240 [Protea cynaroides]|uniref:Plant heme peroxidase family profile domain-containing protein n=1 Tax=Protea cynaroides TaxID=273540 RepID=A0A9Q0HFI2_9MAGN|nr:hypothetical protein NE237_024240 [Protea cynaroides]
MISMFMFHRRLGEEGGLAGMIREYFESKLTTTYYQKKCPQQEKTIQDIITNKQMTSPTTAATTVHFFFHDCMVEGCDASILLPPPPPTRLSATMTLTSASPVTPLTSLSVPWPEAVISLRKITRSNADMRVSLCTPRLLSGLKYLLTTWYSTIQINSVASLMNLSLEKIN